MTVVPRASVRVCSEAVSVEGQSPIVNKIRVITYTNEDPGAIGHCETLGTPSYLEHMISKNSCLGRVLYTRVSLSVGDRGNGCWYPPRVQ